MTKYIEKIIDVNTNEVIERPYTAAETAEVENAIAAAQAAQATLEAIEATKAAEKATLLAKLGITAEEAALLLG